VEIDIKTCQIRSVEGMMILKDFWVWDSGFMDEMELNYLKRTPFANRIIPNT